ncbi:tryptophan-rich sensory protein [Aliiroseovarius sp. S1339]|uniref:tryptophan-rich sensory protein n=1 Tax=Aliiroseovarius sp. S1339 TaxID=2936990 RepID=UPI0020C03E2A|nr:tryptophan-rich sensory protein [Aliiroseovarius sp. S1339]MCK8464665.1 tryptophan-rich sensory protein [Aliiroseovarius sp. S1339]
MSRPAPLLAIAILVLSIVFMLSPLFSSNFAGYSPDQFPTKETFWPVQPAGWAFSIWGLIYVWLIVGAAWGLLKAPNDADWQRMRGPLMISLALGCFWIAAANASPIWATVIIVVMAVTAILAMLRAGPQDPWWQLRPVALYAGWLTAATGVGAGVVLGGYEVLSPQVAALVMLVIVLIVALYVQSLRRGAWSYPLAIIWALFGVIAANWPAQNWAVIGVAVVGIVLLGARAVSGLRTI